MNPVYLDYNATTPVDPRVLSVMLPYFSEKFGNASSGTHSYGWLAKAAVDKAREQVAQLIGSDGSEVYFNSGSTEGINFVLKGIFNAYQTKGNHFITFADEHKAVGDTFEYLRKRGAEVTVIPINNKGQINLNDIEQAINSKTVLLSCMYANNETGVIHPVQEIAEICKKSNVIFFSDATQAAGKINIDVKTGPDALTISGHKVYGPKGAGAVFLRRRNPRVMPEALIHGGGHEKALRSGTLNVPAIVGLGQACELARIERESDVERILILRNKLEDFIKQEFKGIVNGDNSPRLSNTLNIMLPGIASEKLLSSLKDVAFSIGSACTSAVPEPSHVLSAMGLSKEQSYSSVRFSLGRFTTEQEIESVISSLKRFKEKS